MSRQTQLHLQSHDHLHRKRLYVVSAHLPPKVADLDFAAWPMACSPKIHLCVVWRSLSLSPPLSQLLSSFVDFFTNYFHSEDKCKVARSEVPTGSLLKLSLCLTKHHAMKRKVEWKYSSKHSLFQLWIEAVFGFIPRSLYPQRKWPGTHWVGLRIDLDTIENSLAPTVNRTPIDQSAISSLHWTNHHSSLKF
jgi:hypothetical protein